MASDLSKLKVQRLKSSYVVGKLGKLKWREFANVETRKRWTSLWYLVTLLTHSNWAFQKHMHLVPNNSRVLMLPELIFFELVTSSAKEFCTRKQRTWFPTLCTSDANGWKHAWLPLTSTPSFPMFPLRHHLTYFGLTHVELQSFWIFSFWEITVGRFGFRSARFCFFQYCDLWIFD